MAADNFRNLMAYKKAFALVRRSSRSVCSCIGEAYRKRQYEGYFVNKSADADSENTETRVWLDFSVACEYIANDTWSTLESRAEEVGKLINHMIENPEKYQRKAPLKKVGQRTISNRKIEENR